jgi:pre-mRNA-processing factor 6
MKIYDSVDDAMDSRREAQEQAELAKHRAERPKIQQQLADLKRGLSSVTDGEWENIPEVGNLTRKKKRREERSFVVRDRRKNDYQNSLDSGQQEVRFVLLYLNIFLFLF